MVDAMIGQGMPSMRLRPLTTHWTLMVVLTQIRRAMPVAAPPLSIKAVTGKPIKFVGMGEKAG